MHKAKTHRNYQRAQASGTDGLHSALQQLISYKAINAIQLHHVEPLRARVTQWSEKVSWKQRPCVLILSWIDSNTGFTGCVKGIALWKLDLFQNTLFNFLSALHVMGLFVETIYKACVFYN